MTLTWDKPENVTGVFLHYTVSWYRDYELFNSADTTELRYTVEGLEACVNYTVSVTATSEVGRGEQAIITALFVHSKMN